VTTGSEPCGAVVGARPLRNMDSPRVALFNSVSLSFPDRASFSKDELQEWHRAWLAFIAGKNAREAPLSTRLPASAALARSLLCSLPGAESNNICYAVYVYIMYMRCVMC